MSPEILNKVISKMVLPKNPWILNYDVMYLPDYHSEEYVVYYEVSYDFIDNGDFDRIRNLTRNLFNAFGPNKKENLNRVIFGRI